MSSLDDFFSQKDKSKKKKGFVSFNEEVVRKQKEIEYQKLTTIEETGIVETVNVKKDNKIQIKTTSQEDGWNDVLEDSLLADVLPDVESEIDDEDNLLISSDIKNKDDLDEEDEEEALNIALPSVPVPIVVLEEDTKNDTEIANEEDESKKVSSSVRIVMTEEKKEKPKALFFEPKPVEIANVAIDSQEDFPMLSLAVSATSEKSKKQKKKEIALETEKKVELISKEPGKPTSSFFVGSKSAPSNTVSKPAPVVVKTPIPTFNIKNGAPTTNPQPEKEKSTPLFFGSQKAKIVAPPTFAATQKPVQTPEVNQPAKTTPKGAFFSGFGSKPTNPVPQGYQIPKTTPQPFTDTRKNSTPVFFSKS